MGWKSGKPILVSGLGVAIVLGAWEAFQGRAAEVGEWLTLGAVAMGAIAWFSRPTSSPRDFLRPLPPTREKAREAIDLARTLVDYLEAETGESDPGALRSRLAALSPEFDRRTLQVAIAGTRKTGKTSLHRVLTSAMAGEGVSFIDTAPLLTVAPGGEETEILASDLVLYLVNGDLGDSEWRLLREFERQHLRAMLVLNKGDRLPPEEREEILLSLRQRVRDSIAAEDILAIAAAPEALQIRRHGADGGVTEWTETRNPEIAALESRLVKVLADEREALLVGTVWRRALALQGQAKALLNESRRQRALPTIEGYQWLAAAAAFANPVAALDLLAAAAINGQMLVDLGEIYRQKFSLPAAREAAGTIAGLMVGLGVVEVTTGAIAGLLKSNSFTFLAGGTVQGIGAAYLTRLAGLSVIEYLAEREIDSLPEGGFDRDRLGRKILQIFEQNQRLSFWRDFVGQALPRLGAREAIR